MASSILLNKPVVSLVLGAAAVVSYYHFFDTKDECIVKVDGYGAIVVDVVSSAIRGFVDKFFPSYRSPIDSLSTMDPSVARNLTNTLNTMDGKLKSKSSWNVMEDTEALYIIRDMTGLDKKDVLESVEYPNGRERFIEYYRMNVFGSMRVYRKMLYPPAILVIKYVGKVVDDDCRDYPGYTVSIDLPGRFYNTSEIKIDLDAKNKILKITIPKEEAGNWIREISCRTNLNLFRPSKVFGKRIGTRLG